MLTETYLKEHFVDAYFIDNERQNIEILATNDKKTKVFPTIIPFDENNDMFRSLKTVMSVDELHERTYQKKKEERILFEEQLKRIAKKDRTLMSSDTKQKEFFPTVVKAIVNNPDNEDDLFALKLALFEVDEIRDSEDTQLKSAIRKGKTKAEVLLNALKIILA